MNRAVTRRVAFTALALLLGTVKPSVCERPDLPDLPPISPDDRLLILAPHEDDETLGAGGVIQEAVARGAKVRIVYLTYGDHNEWAFLMYRKRLWLTPATNRDMGELRHNEAVQAMAHLGVSAEHLVFLGYPDNGTLTIWKQHWKDSPPMHSILTNTRRVPYNDAFSFGKPYKGEEIVDDLQRIVLDFRPTRIFVTDPLDSNPDHRALYLFLRVALLKLTDQFPTPVVLTYPVHFGPWPRPLKFHPEAWQQLPKILVEEPSPDWMFELSPEQVQRKYETILLYKSQCADSKSWLTSFARKNELFSAPQPIPLQSEAQPPVARWSSTHAVFPTGESESYEEESVTNHLSGVAFRQSNEGLVIQITLHKPISEDLGLSIYAFGYRQDRPFASMPKLNIQWDDGSIRVQDQKTPLRKTGIRVDEGKNQLIVTTPWSVLGLPDAIFVQVHGVVREVPTSQTGWELLLRAPLGNARSKP